ncbi:MAG: ECF transporter S component [Firmicutes bacterium]|nr:ECF transporter S component [Bacillota bacterium]
MNTSSRTSTLVMSALMVAIITVSIMFIKLPIPFTQGYVHLGDAMIFMSVMILGWKHGAIAAAIGGALGDILGGFAMWAPWTFCLKGIMALILGIMLSYALKKQWVMIGRMPLGGVLGMIAGGVVMVAGYYAAEGIMYGNWAVAALGIPWNIGQFVVGMIIAWALTMALTKTSAKKFFAYRFEK